MPRYFAFLRGINVGGHRVAMTTLRDLFLGLGFADVSTFIASGNVIFSAPSGDAPALETAIEARLAEALGYSADTFLRTPEELAAVSAFRPFPAEDSDAPGHTLHVGFLRDAPGDAAGRAIESFRTDFDDFRIHGRELYWLCRGKVSDSPVSWPKVAKAVPMASTMRNVTTVRKLSAKYPPA